MNTSILVIIPTYNERESLPVTLGRLRTAVPHAHVLVADDNSPDGTGEWADSAAATDDHVHVLHRRGKEGLGAAYLAGFAWGLERGYEVLVEMDADGSHRPEQLPRLLDAVARGADLGLGSRWVRGGRVHDWPIHRKFLSVGGNRYVRIMLDLGVNDATGGFRAYRAAVIRYLLDQDVRSQGYCFQVDLTMKTRRAGYTITEVPIDFDERQLGVSKMSGSIVREALWRVTLWGIDYHVGNLRKRFAR